MTPKTEAQAFYNVLPPSRARLSGDFIAPRVTPNAAQIRERRRRIEDIREQLELERQFRLC